MGCFCGLSQQMFVFQMLIFKQVSEVYRKIRNTFRFLHGNLADFHPVNDRVAFKDLREVDQYMYMKLQEVD